MATPQIIGVRTQPTPHGNPLTGLPRASTTSEFDLIGFLPSGRSEEFFVPHEPRQFRGEMFRRCYSCRQAAARDFRDCFASRFGKARLEADKHRTRVLTGSEICKRRQDSLVKALRFSGITILNRVG